MLPFGKGGERDKLLPLSYVKLPSEVLPSATTLEVFSIPDCHIVTLA
jgi:hypothetical protein